MTERITWHRYVNVSIVPDYERAGWIISPDMSKSALHVPHSCYGAIIMDWAGEGEPVEPVVVDNEFPFASGIACE